MKNSKIIKKLLTTVSIASVIVSSEGVLATSRYTTDANTRLSTGMRDIGSGYGLRGWYPAAAPIAFADSSSLYIYQSSDIIADRNNAVINGLDVNGTKASLTVHENLSLGSIVNSAKMIGNGLTIPVKIEENKTLTLTGQGATIPRNGAYLGATINHNDYSALGEINFDNKATTLTVQSHNDGNIKFGANTKALNTDNATLNVKSNLEIADNSFAKVKTININDAKTLKLSTSGANNELKLLETAGSSINFGATGDGKLEITATGRTALGAIAKGWLTWALPVGWVAPDPKIIVENGSLGGNAAGDAGVIELTLNDNTTFSHKGGDVALVGIDVTKRAKKLTINGNDKKLEVTGKIFAKELEFNKGDLTFNNEVDTGADGSSKFLDKTTAKFNEDSKLGKVDFNNTDSTIKVAAGKKLTGTFVGHEGHNDVNGTIVFEGAGELEGTATKIKELKVVGAGNIKLSGKNEIKNIQFHDNDVELAHGFELKGDVNGTAGTQTMLNLGGDVTIDGNIGEHEVVKAINLANDHTKTLTTSANTIKADEIKFDANGGTLKLTHDRLNVGITSNIIVTDNKKGIIDANQLDNAQSLVIRGSIGDIANNKALAAIELRNGRSLSLQNGDVNIDKITIGDDTVIYLNGANSYKIATINNNPNKGKVSLGNNLTLESGTNLGSDASKLEYINLNGDYNITIKDNVGLHALEITNRTRDEGSFTFDGKNIINAQLGKDTSKFKNLTVEVNAELELKKGGHFAGDTTLNGANSKLIIGGDYSSDKIVATIANNGAIEFNNTADINVELKKQAAPVNAIAELKVSGANVNISETGVGANHGLNTKVIKFTNAGADSTLTLPTEFKLDGIDIDNVGNKNHTIVTSGQAGVAFKQTIDAANHIGNNDANLVNIVLNGDEDVLEVKSADFFSTVKTGNAGKNEVIFDVAGGKAYGIGESGKKLKKVTFAENTNNIGDVYANDVVVNDNKIVTFAKNADANIQLGNANGVGSKVIFTGLTDLKGNITTVQNHKGQVTFNDTVRIRNDIGANGRAVAKVEFNGANKNAILYGNIFADQINFGSSNIIIPESVGGIVQNSSLSGDTVINGNIKLNNSTLTFNDGDVTFGPNTTITTALKIGGGFGKIVTKTKIVADSAMRTKVIKIEEEENVGDAKYLFVDIQGGSVEFSDGRDTLLQVASNQAYSSWTLEKSDADGNIYAIRKNTADSKGSADVTAAGGDGTSKQNAGELANNKEASTAIGHIEPQTQISKTRGEAIERVSTTVASQITEEQYNIEKAIDGIVLNRVSNVFTKTNSTISINDENIESAVAAGDEDQEKMIGAWAIPFYSQANQKSKGKTAGYSAKTSGGILGFDVMPSDDLVLGAAVGITKTDMKYKDLKSGDKTTINGFNFSLYGSQQLPDNFFIQGIASFNVGNVNNKEKQIRGNTDNSVITEIAQGKYRSRSFDGEILLGYNAQFADLLLIPTAGLKYSKINGISYKETGTKLQNRTVSRKAFNKVEGIIGTRFCEVKY